MREVSDRDSAGLLDLQISRPKLFPPLHLSAVLPACRLRLEVKQVVGRRPSATQQVGGLCGSRMETGSCALPSGLLGVHFK